MSLRHSVAANFLASAWSALVSLAFVPLYVRLLGIESYALIGFFATLQAWIALLDMGFSATLNRETARFSAGSQSPQEMHDLLRSMEATFMVLAGLFTVAMVGSSSLIASNWLNARALPEQTIVEAVPIMGAAIAAQWIGNLYRSGLLGLQRQLWLSSTLALGVTVRAAGGVAVLLFVAPTIIAFFLFQLAVSTVETLIIRWYLRRCLPPPPAKPRFSLAALGRVRGFAGGMALVTLLATVLTQLDKLLLAKLLPLDQFGYFMLVITAAGALSALTLPIHNVAYPRFAATVAAGDDEAMTFEYHRFAQLLALGVVPASFMLSVFAEDIILLWTRDEQATRAVAPVLQVWVIGTMLNALVSVPYMAQLAHGWTRLSVAGNTLAVAIIVPALLWLVPLHGATAAAWIWVAINAAYVLVTIPIMHSRILTTESRRWYGADVLAPMAGAAAAVWLLKALLGGGGGGSPLAQVMVGGVFVLLVTGLCTELGRDMAVSLGKRALGR